MSTNGVIQKTSSKYGLDNFLILCFNLINKLLSRVELTICLNGLRNNRLEFNWNKQFDNKSGRFYLYLNTDRIKDKDHVELEYEADFINTFRYAKNATKKDYKKLGDIWAKWRSNVLICRNDTNILNPLNWTMSQRKTIDERHLEI